MKKSNRYSLPIRGSARRCQKSSAHTGKLKHAVDFLIPEGTTIYAACGGTVVYVKDSSKVGGTHRRFWFHGNRIVIAHADGEYTAYEHLQYKGSDVSVGQRVRRGQRIGKSGNTGYSSGPHLHFEVFIQPSADESEGATIPVRFRRK